MIYWFLTSSILYILHSKIYHMSLIHLIISAIGFFTLLEHSSWSVTLCIKRDSFIFALIYYLLTTYTHSRILPWLSKIWAFVSFIRVFASSLIPVFVHPVCIYCVADGSGNCTHLHIYPFIYLFIHSLKHSFIYSFIKACHLSQMLRHTQPTTGDIAPSCTHLLFIS